MSFDIPGPIIYGGAEIANNRGSYFATEQPLLIF